MKYVNIFCLLQLLFIENVYSTLSQSDRVKSKTTKYQIKVGPQQSNVFERGLVVSDPSAKDIIQENAAYYEKREYRNFNGAVLGYVTPWNGHGYEIAKNFSSKFSHISPVWLQIKRLGTNQYEVTGTHDIDKKWLKSVRNGNPKVKIDVRVFFDGWTVSDFTALFNGLSERSALAKTIVETCLSHKFDGIVLELWSQVGGSVRSDVLVDLIKLVSNALKDKDLELILVIPPIHGNGPQLFSTSDFDALFDSVVGFSLMTYDFSNAQRPGPNSPIEWAKQSVTYLAPAPGERRAKILLGLNFYGNNYTPSGGGPIVGRDFINLLKDYKGKLKHDDVSIENFFEVRSGSGKHLVFFPTLYSIHRRIKLAEELGVGLSIWELGQGLDYFYDLL